MFLLSGVRLIHVNTHWVWPFVLIGVGPGTGILSAMAFASYQFTYYPSLIGLVFSV